jgi:hypothetical protein
MNDLTSVNEYKKSYESCDSENPQTCKLAIDLNTDCHKASVLLQRLKSEYNREKSSE